MIQCALGQYVTLPDELPGQLPKLWRAIMQCAVSSVQCAMCSAGSHVSNALLPHSLTPRAPLPPHIGLVSPEPLPTILASEMVHDGWMDGWMDGKMDGWMVG